MARRSNGPTWSAAPQRFDPKLLSDPVVRREDGSWLYLLPSVIDDIDLGVTHVVRGEDHVSNSAAQLQMFEALGAKPPELAHEALLVAAEGKLSKRLGSIGVEEIRGMGLEPMALLSLLGRLGTSQPVEPIADLDELAADLRLRPFRPRAGAFRPARRRAAQCPAAAPARLCRRRRPPARRRDRSGLAAAARQSRAAVGFRRLVRRDRRRDRRRPSSADDERALVAKAAEIAPTLDWSNEPWKALAEALKAATGLKGSALFHPLRLALTGRDSGPEMAGLLTRMGRTAPLARLAAAARAEAASAAA